MKQYKDGCTKEYDEGGVWYPLPDNPNEKWTPPEGWQKLKDWCTKYRKETDESVEKRKAERDKKLEEERFKDKKSRDRNRNKVDESQDEPEVKDIKLPSWVAPASRAPFILDNHPGMRVMRMGRANADPLVGQPTDGHRNYSAAQTRHVNLEVLKFRKRPELSHYSMYVQGFELDEVKEVVDASQGGSIPVSWLQLGGWESPYKEDPPDELWKTLVADRGRDNRNPPYYYARACRESVHKGNTNSGRVKTGALINNERNSIVTEFCRRVHAVIWNRRMFKTKAGRLGLAYDVEKGDKVCVLYGYTVPVILKQQKKTIRDDEKGEDGDLAREELEDSKEALKACIRQCEKNRELKKKRRSRNEKNKKKWLDSGEWYEMMDAMTDARKKAVKQLEDERKRREEEAERERGQDDDDEDMQEREDLPDGRAYKSKLQERVKEAEQNDPHLFYKIRGDCYLHGMMDGEAVRQKFYEELPDRVFELR